MMMLGLSLLIPVATGILLLRLLWPREAQSWPWPLGAALGAGFGIGFASVALFLWMLMFGATRGALLVEVAALLGVAIATVARWRSTVSTAGAIPVPAAASSGRRVPVLLGGALLVALILAMVGFLVLLQRQPHGEWDAWMNWDLKARMMYRGGEGWRAAFSAALPWSHPDYPVLVPSLVVRSWLYAGRETLRGPALVAAGFTFGTVALLVAALATLRSHTQALLAGLLLLSTPVFIIHGTSLYADVPAGFFFLMTIVCLALDGYWGSGTTRFAVLAGVAAGLAMWTKNEGLLFTFSAAAGLALISRQHGWAFARRKLIAFGLGVLPFLLLYGGFKAAFAPPNDLLSTLGIERTVGNLTDPERYYLTLRAYALHIPAFGRNDFGTGVWLLITVVLGFGINRLEMRRPWATAAMTTFGLLLAGHFVVFVSMAHELQRLLNSSLDRLLLQLWPSLLFVMFAVVSTPEERQARQPGVS